MLYQATVQADDTLDQSPANLRGIFDNFMRIRDDCGVQNNMVHARIVSILATFTNYFCCCVVLSSVQCIN